MIAFEERTGYLSPHSERQALWESQRFQRETDELCEQYGYKIRCRNCGETFLVARTPNDYRRRYCGDECRRDARREAARKCRR